MYHTTLNSFPIVGKEERLPFYLNAVGRNEFEPDVNRPEGFYLHQLIFCTEGEGELKVEGQTYRIGKGDAIFIHEHIPHEYRRITSPWITHFLVFGGFACPEIFKEFEWGNHVLFSQINTKNLLRLFHKQYLLSTEEDFGSRCKNSALVYDCIVDIFAQTGKPEPLAKSLPTSNKTLLLAKRYIEQYYFTELSLDNIAEYANVTPQHLCRLFKKHLHMSPNNYVIQIRMNQAKINLQTTEDSILAIAERVGFNTASYFTLTFKKWENMTPTEYRILSRNP